MAEIFFFLGYIPYGWYISGGGQIHQVWLPMAEQGSRVFIYTQATIKSIIPLFFHWYISSPISLFSTNVRSDTIVDNKYNKRV